MSDVLQRVGQQRLHAAATVCRRPGLRVLRHLLHGRRHRSHGRHADGHFDAAAPLPPDPRRRRLRHTAADHRHLLPDPAPPAAGRFSQPVRRWRRSVGGGGGPLPAILRRNEVRDADAAAEEQS